jgi:hypothetical protein
MKMKRLGLAAIAFALIVNANAAFAEDEQKWYDTLSISGMVDARVVYKRFSTKAEGVDDVESSDIQTRYAGIGFEINPTDHIEAYVLFLFEEFYGGRESCFPYHGDGSENFDMDEGWLKLNYSGGFLRMGKGYLPFTHETTFAVKDPLTWYYGDCRHTFGEIGYEHDYFATSLGVFNCDSDNRRLRGNAAADGEQELVLDDDTLDSYVFHAHVLPLAAFDDHELEIGLGIISDVTEGAIGCEFIEPGSAYERDVPAYAGYLHYEGELTDTLGLGVELEYVASEKFAAQTYLDSAGDRTRLYVTNAELAAFLYDDYWIGLKHESIRGIDWLHTAQYDPEFKPRVFSSFGGFAGTDILEPVTLAFQFMAGSDDESNQLIEATFQTLLEF